MNQAVKLTLLLLVVLLTNGCRSKTEAPDQFQNSAVMPDETETYEEAGQVQYQKESVKDNGSDPLLLCYLLYDPNIRVDISSNVVMQRIWYENFDQKKIAWGDEPDEMYNVFLFHIKTYMYIIIIII